MQAAEGLFAAFLLLLWRLQAAGQPQANHAVAEDCHVVGFLHAVVLQTSALHRSRIGYIWSGREIKKNYGECADDTSISTGSKTATGVNCPVFPMLHSTSLITVSNLSSANLYANCDRTWRCAQGERTAFRLL